MPPNSKPVVHTPWESLTRHGLQPSGARGLVPPRRLPHEFVTSCERYDGQERPDQGECVVDVPAAEYDAQVLGGPGEEHLRGTRRGQYCVALHGHDCGELFTFMLQRWGMGMFPWSMLPWSMAA